VGDFNVDLNKDHDQNYHLKRYTGDLTKFQIEQNLTRVVMDDTWSRTIGGRTLSSKLDHVYHTADMAILKTTSQPAAYSDHNIVCATMRVGERVREEGRILDKKLVRLHKREVTEQNE
jgi:endonuclease/exonuclease/phosphatase family metal-dependent hydrolase